MKNIFAKSISQIFTGAVKAFRTFPATIACALGFSVVTMIRIQLDWQQQAPYNFLFNCLHWSFALGAVFSLAAITYARSRFDGDKAFKLANAAGAAAVAVTFLLLYIFSASHTNQYDTTYVTVSGIAASRVSVAMLVSMVAFVILAASPKEHSDFERSLFMTQKAFFIAAIYGAVIMAGTSAVAGAFQALIYREMSNKVYQYIGTIVGFLAFTIFVGYFPDFTKGKTDEKREMVQKQPRFVEVLFEYIMVPIMFALTAVLLIWAGRTILTGQKVTFEELAGISTSFAVFGIWLHVMVTRLESGLAKFYKKFYPFAALLILAFEAWALAVQLGKSGMKDTEYFFMLLWVIAAAAAVLLIAMKAKSHAIIALITCALAVFSVLPLLGYNALPVASQVTRLEKILVSQNMLQDGKLVPAATEPDKTVRESVTDAVNYLAYAQDAQLPAWFDKKLSESDTFKKELGFDQTWPEVEYPGKNQYTGTYLNLPSGSMDISGYKWVVNMNNEGKGDSAATVKGVKGTYTIHWTTSQQNGLPTLRVDLDGKVILEQSMKEYADGIAAEYPPGTQTNETGKLDDMTLKIDTPEVSMLLVFTNLQINVDNQQDTINYYLNLGQIYMNEK
jgi:hypothetical protein